MKLVDIFSNLKYEKLIFNVKLCLIHWINRIKMSQYASKSFRMFFHFEFKNWLFDQVEIYRANWNVESSWKVTWMNRYQTVMWISVAVCSSILREYFTREMIIIDLWFENKYNYDDRVKVWNDFSISYLYPTWKERNLDFLPIPRAFLIIIDLSIFDVDRASIDCRFIWSNRWIRTKKSLFNDIIQLEYSSCAWEILEQLTKEKVEMSKV